MVNYQNGKIYKIEPICDHEENDIYIGSTAEERLCNRMAKHRESYKCWKNGKCRTNSVYNLFDKYGIENCQILLLENYCCNSKNELEAKEGEYMRNLSCINKRIAGRTAKEYYIDNKEYLQTLNKQYAEDNKEQLKEYYKQYYDEHKENIKQYRIYYYHENKEALKQKSKDYYDSNKEAIIEKRKEIVNCVCGGCYTYQHKARHLKTKKHLTYLEENVD